MHYCCCSDRHWRKFKHTPCARLLQEIYQVLWITILGVIISAVIVIVYFTVVEWFETNEIAHALLIGGLCASMLGMMGIASYYLALIVIGLCAHLIRVIRETKRQMADEEEEGEVDPLLSLSSTPL
jgi:chromate transport protein ChrA